MRREADSIKQIGRVIRDHDDEDEEQYEYDDDDRLERDSRTFAEAIRQSHS